MQLPKTHGKVLILLLFTLLLVISTAMAVSRARKRQVTNEKPKGSTMVEFQTKDFHERGIYLVGPSNPLFAKMATQLTKNNEVFSVNHLPPYSVFLKNTNNRSVVGYRIVWDCVDKQGDSAHKDASNIVSYIFLHGRESERNRVMAGEGRIIGPNSTWFISSDGTAMRLEGVTEGQVSESIFASQLKEISNEFSKVTISLDGLFLDDGTFFGADTTAFFDEVKSQMDARYEILNEVENSRKSGTKIEEILRKLEEMAKNPTPQLGVSPSRSEYMDCFRVLFAKDVLGMKAIFGTEKAMEDVHQQLSEPWVNLRRL